LNVLYYPRFPGGKCKALVISYDDGSEHDRRLLDLFNRYGIRGSFYLNSGKLGQPHHISTQEVQSLYRGHEVASHTVNHPDLTQLSDAAVRQEIRDDQRALEDLTGQPVRGLAYPFGIYDARILALLPELGIAYGRTATATGTFQVPKHFLAWESSCHQNQAMALGRRFLRHQSQEPALLYIWGHSYELDGFMSGDPSKNWDYLETLCRLLQGHAEIYYATTIELVDYLNALSALIPAGTELSNTSTIPLWINWQNSDLMLTPGSSVSLIP